MTTPPTNNSFETVPLTTWFSLHPITNPAPESTVAPPLPKVTVAPTLPLLNNGLDENAPADDTTAPLIATTAASATPANRIILITSHLLHSHAAITQDHRIPLCHRLTPGMGGPLARCWHPTILR